MAKIAVTALNSQDGCSNKILSKVRQQVEVVKAWKISWHGPVGLF